MFGIIAKREFMSLLTRQQLQRKNRRKMQYAKMTKDTSINQNYCQLNNALYEQRQND